LSAHKDDKRIEPFISPINICELSLDIAIVETSAPVELLIMIGFLLSSISANKNKEQSTNIEELNILKYIPEKNKLLFISNLDSFNIINNNEKDKNPKNQDNFILIKDSILDYLGIDLRNNKLEDIYDNELIIATFEDNKNLKDDILIVFKIKQNIRNTPACNVNKPVDDIAQTAQEIAINRGTSLLTILLFTLRGVINELIPKTTRTLKILLPITLLAASESLPFKIELKLTNNSGELVPRETTVNPITI